MGLETWANMELYANQGFTWFHELLHIDWVSLSNKYGNNERVEDVKVSFWFKDPADPTKTKASTKWVYGPFWTKVLARLRDNVAYWTIRSADNLAYYAMANCVQNKVGIYPHLPVSPLIPAYASSPLVGPGVLTFEADGTLILATNTTVWDEKFVGQSGGLCSL